jgi:hypothetical protein
MFHGWENYFGMLGTASAGLIGLLFVVVTLTANFETTQAQRGQALYMTPTGLNFASVLAVCALTLAPGLSPAVVAGALGMVALFGLGNSLRSSIGIARPLNKSDRPHWSDFWCYGAAPVVIYLGLGAAAIGVTNRASWAVYALAGTLLFQLLLGIRNAWDLVTYIAPRANTLNQTKGDAAGDNANSDTGG